MSWTGSERGGTSAAAREEALFLFHISWLHSPIYPRGGGSMNDHPSPFFHLAGLCRHLRAALVENLTVAFESGISEANVCTRNTSREAEAVVAPEKNNVTAHWQALLAALPWVRILRLHRCGPPSVSVLGTLASSADFLLPYLQKVFLAQNIVRCATARIHAAVLWNIERLTGIGLAGAHELAHANLGAQLVAAVKGRYGLEVILIGCEVDDCAGSVAEASSSKHWGRT